VLPLAEDAFRGEDRVARGLRGLHPLRTRVHVVTLPGTIVLPHTFPDLRRNHPPVVSTHQEFRLDWHIAKISMTVM
jgi:DNA-binding transcriptional LysR family regulator